MHTVHTTPGFIIGSRPYGDAGKILIVFTREFGLIYATAQGIRLERSKLRYHIQDHSFGTYSLVRGREYWRLTGADEIGSMEIRGLRLEEGARSSEYGEKSRELIARLALLLRRLLQGEEPHPELFDHIIGSVEFLQRLQADRTTRDEADLETFESLIVAKMLHALGYIGKLPESLEEIISTKVSVRSLQELANERAILNQHINKALHESML